MDGSRSQVHPDEHRRAGAASAVVVDIVSGAGYNTAGVGVLPADDSLLALAQPNRSSPTSPTRRYARDVTGISDISSLHNVAMAMEHAMEHAVGHPEYRYRA